MKKSTTYYVICCLRRRADYALPESYGNSKKYVLLLYTYTLSRTYMFVQCFKMADNNEKLLSELLKKPGNSSCADCGAKSKYFIRKANHFLF